MDWPESAEELQVSVPVLHSKEVSLGSLGPSGEKESSVTTLRLGTTPLLAEWPLAQLAHPWKLTQRNSLPLSSWCSYNRQEVLMLRWKISYLQRTGSTVSLRTCGLYSNIPHPCITSDSSHDRQLNIICCNLGKWEVINKSSATAPKQHIIHFSYKASCVQSHSIHLISHGRAEFRPWCLVVSLWGSIVLLGWNCTKPESCWRQKKIVLPLGKILK